MFYLLSASLVVVGFVTGYGAIVPAPGDARTRLGCVRGTADVDALLHLEDEWATALVRRDGGVFRRLLADGFVYTENDQMVDREAVLQDVVSGTDTVRAARNEDMQVHCFGSTAAVTGWLITSGRGAGGPFEHRYRFTDTWVREAGRWQIVAAHDYLAPEKRD